MENHGANPKRSRKITREHVEAMRRLWGEDEASDQAKYLKFSRVWSYPKPITRPNPPIILGTFTSGAGRHRVTDFGDG
jgi:alkanesulfonate monooxygenase SsuD/methylene tetrahydromethanopterin reductase-like flavin-dependent oxidoreductase (luciferase family)